MLDRERWAIRLATVASRALGDDPAIPLERQFRDNRGNQLEIDTPFFAVLRGEVADCPAASRSDVRFWAWLSGAVPASDLQRLLTPPPKTSPAPLLARQRDDEAIEVYTDLLLCATHAAWTLGGPSSPVSIGADERVNLRRRCELGCEWLMANLQPDNATNYPWAIHVLLACSGTLGHEATHYAETMLHNCQVTYGVADLRSAWILWHAARELRNG